MSKLLISFKKGQSTLTIEILYVKELDLALQANSYLQSLTS